MFEIILILLALRLLCRPHCHHHYGWGYPMHHHWHHHGWGHYHHHFW